MSTPASVNPFYQRICRILEAAREGLKRTVNTTQVVANWLIGREIVEEQQRGQKRAAYRRKLLSELSAMMSSDFGRGYSVDNLEAFRLFYLAYPDLISATASRKSGLLRKSATASRKSLAPSTSMRSPELVEWFPTFEEPLCQGCFIRIWPGLSTAIS